MESDGGRAHQHVQGEIVGAPGRMGSAFYRFSQSSLHSVGRHEPIGISSPASTPIYICTGVDALEDVLQRTIPERIQDLVIMQNGLLRGIVEEYLSALLASRGREAGLVVTFAVLYFSVLERGGAAKSGGKNFVHGRWARTFAELLMDNGLDCEVVASGEELDARAAEKLIWTSSLWLMCHRKGQRSVGEVHEDREMEEVLYQLIKELLDVVVARLGVPDGGFATAGGDVLLGSAEGVLGRMRDYSMRISGAVPSRKLALEELPRRNGWFLAGSCGLRQDLHLELLEAQGVVLMGTELISIQGTQLHALPSSGDKAGP